MKIVSRSTRAFTLVEIMIVVAIIALLAAIALPSFLRARKRSQAAAVLNELRMIDAAIDQFAIENNQQDGAPVGVSQWKKYIKAGTPLYATGQDRLGRNYGPQLVGRLPHVSAATKSDLADVADDAFWSPYNPASLSPSSDSPANPGTRRQ